MATAGRIKINIFWHVLLKNHALDIIEEQLKCLLESGLYERCDSVRIGLIIADKSLNDGFYQVIKGYDKISLLEISHNELDYEFITLDRLKHSCDVEQSFYGLYIHTKGVSYPGNEGGKYWRDYMNYYNITKWKDAVNDLDLGYELYGVKLLTQNDGPAHKMHYSGNYFWFWSDYVSLLEYPRKLNRKNRGEAEMWICSGNPIAGTGCQVFVDYDTRGEFKPFKIKSNI